MTVSNETFKSNYTGSSSAGPFPIGFSILLEEHIGVYRTLIESGNVEALSLNAITNGYSVNSDLSEVTLTEPVSNAYRVTIVREISIKQMLDIISNDPFPAESIEQNFDLLVMVLQSVKENIGRALTLTSGSLQDDVTVADLVAGKFLVVSEDGESISMSSADASAVLTTYSTLLDNADDLAALAAIADSLTDIGILSPIAADISTLATNITNITTLAAVSSEIASLAAISADITTVAGAVADLNALAAQLASLEQENLIWNGQMKVWERGVSTGTLSSSASRRIGLADGFTLGCATLRTGIEAQRILGDTERYAMQVARTSGETFTDEINMVFNLTADEVWSLRGQEISFGFTGKKGVGYSSASDALKMEVRYTTHSSEQAITNADGTYGTDDNLGEELTATLTTSWQDFSGAFTVPTDCTQLYVRLSYTPVGTANSTDYFQIERVFLKRGATSSLKNTPTYQAFYQASRFFKKSHNNDPFDGEANVTILSGEDDAPIGNLAYYVSMMDAPMHGTPTVIIYHANTGATGAMSPATGASTLAASAKNIGTHGFTVSNDAVGPSSATQYSFAFSVEYLF